LNFKILTVKKILHGKQVGDLAQDLLELLY